MAAAVPQLVIAQGGGDFLVSPNLGLMIWTLVAFVITLLILRKAAFPRIADALDRRRRAVEESIDAADRTRAEADRILAEYRERLREAREQAERLFHGPFLLSVPGLPHRRRWR